MPMPVPTACLCLAVSPEGAIWAERTIVAWLILAVTKAVSECEPEFKPTGIAYQLIPCSKGSPCPPDPQVLPSSQRGIFCDVGRGVTDYETILQITSDPPDAWFVAQHCMSAQRLRHLLSPFPQFPLA